jgi:hypothetical protein
MIVINCMYIYTYIYVLAVLEFKLRALHLLGRCTTTYEMLPAQVYFLLGMVVHSYNPSIQEAEARG